ncbi:plastid lipid-associated PAP/fibrillin family protein [Nitzschia inconspicua]|uniref:Plastid lipid-associated PAP/fibrillin family protein n=1 Tax=Nitzschia inconspicua TaxID=303405 RepID=A0A9K3LSS7_9STRA|nr:plastid lipid-associated PAP/fibrillin family protein [Nitzschia inconspicua]
MKFFFLAVSTLLVTPSWSFQVRVPALNSKCSNRMSPSPLLNPLTVAASDADITDVAMNLDMSVAIAKEELLELVEDLKATYGILLIDKKAQDSFKEAVEKLEEVSEPPTDTTLLTGNWTLLCSTTTTKQGISGIDTSKLPFFNEGPLKDIRDTINQSLKVEQKIKAGEFSDGVDAIDHVIDYKPPNKLSNVLKSFPANIPDAIKDLNINPLQVSESKVVLKHKAEIESVIPVIKTKLVLQSIVLNVAGKSQILDPSGADVLGVNIPFGEYLNAGSFDTTFLDDTVRISRSKVGPVDQIRVFIKSEVADVLTRSIDDDVDDDELAEDVDTTVDAEFEDDDDDDIVESPSDVEG